MRSGNTINTIIYYYSLSCNFWRSKHCNALTTATGHEDFQSSLSLVCITRASVSRARATRRKNKINHTLILFPPTQNHHTSNSTVYTDSLITPPIYLSNNSSSSLTHQKKIQKITTHMPESKLIAMPGFDPGTSRL